MSFGATTKGRTGGLEREAGSDVAQQHAGAGVRTAHGVYALRPHRCGRPAELAGEAAAGEPYGLRLNRPVLFQCFNSPWDERYRSATRR
jgi:hypothetical protein